MVTAVELEIRERLADYVGGRIDLRQFQEWFVPRAWREATAHPAGPLQDLISTIELRLAEFTNGHLTAQEFKESLSSLPYVTRFAHRAEDSPRTWTSSASNSTLADLSPS